MGIAIGKDHFEEREYEEFARRLRVNLQALRRLLARPSFGEGPPSIGAELELFLVDRGGQPRRANEEILAELPRESWTTELGRFNIECNTQPQPLAGRPFAALARALDEHLHQARQSAARHDARVVMVGILPTLQPAHFGKGAITDEARYRAMNEGLRRLRQEPFHLRIHGEDDLEIDARDCAYESANTSFQVHLRVPPARFRDVYNAAQLATPVVLAAAGNAPFFLGRRLWDETRIALFKQAVDDRDELQRLATQAPPRVCFGRDWLAGGVEELFADAVAWHAPIMAVSSDEDANAEVAAGRVPKLLELRLHNGTVWRWNRPVFDPSSGGHVRIELRALPAGPTVTDMTANAAFLLGLTLGLAPRMPALSQRLPFASVHANFYRAARSGLDAELTFPDAQGRLSQVRARELGLSLLALAREGLLEAGVAADDADGALAVMHARLQSGRTGARWLRAALAERTAAPSGEAFAAVLASYSAHSAGGLPVHQWPTALADAPPRVQTPHPEVPALTAVPRPAPTEVPASLLAFVRGLPGPTWMRLPGQDGSRVRVVCTLLHGNEPSGITAMHRYLRSPRRPAVDTIFYIAQVETARADAGFAHRMLPGRRDFNRCFGPPYDDEEGQRALAFMAALARASAERPVEAVIDLHNNTGQSPAYGVGCGVDDARLNLTDLFGDFYIDSDIRLRTLTEFAASYAPAVSIECGTAGDPAADAVALAGLERLLSVSNLDLPAPSAGHIKVLSHPVRVHVRHEIDLHFAERPPTPGTEPAPLTVRAGLDLLNFTALPAGTCIGWLRDGTGWPLDARAASGVDVSQRLFEQVGSELRTRTELVPIMMTGDAVSAKADCLFYAMAPRLPRV